MRMIALALLMALTGCATGPMTQEERDSSDRTLRALQILNASPWGTRPAQQQAQPTAYLKSSYISGFNRICIYDRLGSQFITTIGNMEICPLSQ